MNVAAAHAYLEDTTGLEIEVNGEPVVLHPSGCAYLPAHGTLVASDLHLEKASSFAAKGVFLPPYDTGATLARLAGAVDALAPRRVVTLGDNFHDVGGARRMQSHDRTMLDRLTTGRDWTWILGNHDPALPKDLGGEILHELRLGRLVLRHTPASGDAPGEVAGHLHPCARLASAGRPVRRPCFVSDGARLLMPALGALTGGLHVTDAAIGGLFAGDALPFLLGRDRVYPVSQAMIR